MCVCVCLYVQSNLTERPPPNKDPLPTKTAQNPPREITLYFPSEWRPLVNKDQRPSFFFPKPMFHL